MSKDFKELLKNELETRNISLKELSKKTGISQLILNYYLSGRTKPNKRNEVKILNVLNKTK